MVFVTVRLGEEHKFGGSFPRLPARGYVPDVTIIIIMRSNKLRLWRTMIVTSTERRLRIFHSVASSIY